MNRKSFIKKSLAGGLAAAALPTGWLVAQEPKTVFSKEEISEFVFAAHNDLDATRKIVEAKPNILNCANQRTKGDFETAMGGASHMGRRDIADLLVSHGARLDMFNYTFLGYDDFIRKIITDYPKLLNAPGPHGFTLLHHALKGERTELADWLREKGLTETHFKGVFG